MVCSSILYSCVTLVPYKVIITLSEQGQVVKKGTEAYGLAKGGTADGARLTSGNLVD